MPHRSLTWKIGGEAGFGIMTTGLILSKVFNRAGLNIFDSIEYPSLIRGGHNTFQVTTSEGPLYSQHQKVNLLLALNEQTITLHKDELSDRAVVIYDGERVDITSHQLSAQAVSVPLNRLAREMGKDPLTRNTVGLGATIAIAGLDFAYLEDVITDMFGKHPEVIASNVQAAKGGYEAVVSQSIDFHYALRPTTHGPKWVMTGNEAIGMGAVAAGLKLYCAYPMTPASSIMHYLASVQDKHSLYVKHVEDEISAINMAIGGAYAGVRAMTASSGGGFALMVEGYTLAAMTETPLVIAEVMRPGPATGLPTWTGQEDLQFVLHAGHGEFPRVVIAPGDTEECFYLTQEAFNLAEIYQTPIIILSDLYLAENYQTTSDLSEKIIPIDRGALLTAKQAAAAKEEYRRYAVTESGISPRKIPGQAGGVFVANSDEHDEYGFSNEEADNRLAQVEKRARKIDHLLEHVLPIKLHGPKDADVTIVCYGSTKRPALEAAKQLKEEGIMVSVLQVIYMAPFPAQQFLDIVRGAKHLLLVEASQSAQFGSLIHEYTKVDIKHRYLKYDGRVIYPEELIAVIKKEFTHGRY